MNAQNTETMELIGFGTGILGYKEEHMADRYFKKKFNEFWGLEETNNTGTKAEVMTFAKEKASKGSKLQEWYNKVIEGLLEGVFTKEIDAELERTSYTYVKKAKTSTPKVKKEKVVGGTNSTGISNEEIQSDAEVLGKILQEDNKGKEVK